jgi:hypothetical protein
MCRRTTIARSDRDRVDESARTVTRPRDGVGTIVNGIAVMVVEGASQGSYIARAAIAAPGMGFRIVGGLGGSKSAALESVPITAHLLRDDSEVATAEMKKLSDSCTWPD